MARNTTPQKIGETEEQRAILIGSNSEAETYFKSPYWGLSYHFPYNPDPLASGNNYAIYDEMIDDDQVKAALSVKKDMVVNTGWMINGDKPEVNDFITKTLENINIDADLENSFDDVLRDILSAYDYGFSLSEPVHQIKNGKVIYKSIRTRPPHSFRFHLDDKGNILSIEQATSIGDIQFKTNKFLHHVYQMEFGNPYGKSDLRAGYNAWKAKKYFTRFYAVYVEKYASPPLIGKYPKNYSTEERNEFFNKLITNQHATTFAIPDDVMVEFVQTARDSSDVYLKGLDYYNMQISRSILVPDLMGIGGKETQGGSYALGKEQFKVFLSSIKKDRESIERKITNKLIRPLVLANFGDIPCWFEFKPYTFDDVKEYLDLWVKAVHGKIFKANDEEINYFRQAVGFPDGEVERIAPPPAPIMPPMQSPPGQKEEDTKDVDGEDTEEEPEEEVEEKTLKYAYRNFTSFENKINFAQVEKTLARGGGKILKRTDAVMKKIYLDLITQIRERGLLTKFKPEAIEKIKPKYQRELNQVFKTYYADLFKDSYNQAQREVMPDDKKKFAIELLPEEFLELLTVESFKQVGDYTFNVTKRAKNIVLHGIKDGIGQGEILKVLREELRNTSETWASTVLRTKTNEIYNEARKKYFETDPIAKQIVVAYQWSSILDDRTSDICNYLDNKIFDVKDSGSIKPPAHFNCRSLLVPITKFEKFKTTPRSALSDDKLKAKGGSSLLLAGNRKFAIGNDPLLSNSASAQEFGDSVAIAGAGDKKHIQVLSISISNMDMTNPVTVSFKGKRDQEYRYKTLLAKTDNWSKDFPDEYWKLNNNEALVINLSAPVQIEYTIEYIITDKNDKRIK